MTVRQCPEPSCPFVTSDTAALIAHRNSHEVVSLFKTPPSPKKPKRGGLRKPGAVEQSTRQAVYHAAHGKCMAHGLHDPACPQHTQNASIGEFVAHHVQPRRANGTHTADNLIWLWNGTTGLAAGGCHGRVHQHQRIARCLGLLAESPSDAFHNIGLEAGYRLGFLTDDALRAAGYDPATIPVLAS